MPIRTLLQNERLLRVRELRCLHRFLLVPAREIREENSNSKGSNFQGAEHKMQNSMRELSKSLPPPKPSPAAHPPQCAPHPP
jgi:hypothetical protein